MPTATSTLEALGTTIINTGVSLATIVFQTYWPYILVFGVLIALAYWVKRVVGMGHR
jgi:hypothetical protein